MCSLKTSLIPCPSPNNFSLRYDAASFSLADLVLEFLDSCSRAKGSGSGNDLLIVQSTVLTATTK